MGGIVAHVGMGAPAPNFDAALAILCHNRGFRSRTIVSTDSLHLGVVFREDDLPSSAWASESQVGAIVYGIALLPGETHRPATADRIIDTYLHRGIASVGALDGGFAVAIVDLQRGQLHVVNDRMATIPVQFLMDGTRVVVAPEAKAIFAMLGRRPEIDHNAAVTFLDAGFALGDNTLFEGAHLLEPAQVLTADLLTAEVTRTTYWRLSFQPDQKLSARQAADDLYDSLAQCHTLTLADDPRSVRLLLTGGFDSRTVLGFLANSQHLPAECLTWGVRDDIPGSDPTIARALAARYGAPWTFLAYDGDHFAKNALEWAFVSELASDNLGCFAAGPDLLNRSGTGMGAVLNGDQLLGTGGLPISRADAIESASGLPRSGVSPGLEALLKTECIPQAGALVKGQLDRLADECPNDSAKDLQDFLGIHIRVARWLNASACFREPMVSPRRPMLMRPAIDMFTRLSPELRVDKRLLVEMLRRRMPELLHEPKNAANSLIDWDMHFTGHEATGELFRECLAGWPRLGRNVIDSLDPDRVESAIARYLHSSRRPLERGPRPERVLPGMRRFFSRVPVAALGLRAVERATRVVRRRPIGAPTERVLKRLVLLVLLQRCIDQGRFESTRGNAGQSAAAPASPSQEMGHDQPRVWAGFL